MGLFESLSQGDRSSPTWGLGRGVSTPAAPYRLYRGRPGNPNSYFVDRAGARASRVFSSKCKETSVSS